MKRYEYNNTNNKNNKKKRIFLFINLHLIDNDELHAFIGNLFISKFFM